MKRIRINKSELSVLKYKMKNFFGNILQYLFAMALFLTACCVVADVVLLIVNVLAPYTSGEPFSWTIIGLIAILPLLWLYHLIQHYVIKFFKWLFTKAIIIEEKPYCPKNCKNFNKCCSYFHDVWFDKELVEKYGNKKDKVDPLAHETVGTTEDTPVKWGYTLSDYYCDTSNMSMNYSSSGTARIEDPPYEPLNHYWTPSGHWNDTLHPHDKDDEALKSMTFEAALQGDVNWTEEETTDGYTNCCICDKKIYYVIHIMNGKVYCYNCWQQHKNIDWKEVLSDKYCINCGINIPRGKFGEINDYAVLCSDCYRTRERCNRCGNMIHDAVDVKYLTREDERVCVKCFENKPEESFMEKHYEEIIYDYFPLEKVIEEIRQKSDFAKAEFIKEKYEEFQLVLIHKKMKKNDKMINAVYGWIDRLMKAVELYGIELKVYKITNINGEPLLQIDLIM